MLLAGEHAAAAPRPASPWQPPLRLDPSPWRPRAPPASFPPPLALSPPLPRRKSATPECCRGARRRFHAATELQPPPRDVQQRRRPRLRRTPPSIRARHPPRRRFLQVFTAGRHFSRRGIPPRQPLPGHAELRFVLRVSPSSSPALPRFLPWPGASSSPEQSHGRRRS